MRSRRSLAVLAALTLLGSMLTIVPTVIASGGSGTTRQIPRVGTSSLASGSAGSDASIQDPEFAIAAGAPAQAEVDRSLSQGGPTLTPSTPSGKKAKSNPILKVHWDGLNFPEQRRANGGNQFSVEPPDQALCAGNGDVVEAVNDVVNVYNSAGVSQLPANTVGGAVALNTFYGYPAAINRSIPPGNPGRFGPFVTDPSCYFDTPTQRWFMVVLTLDVNSTTDAFLGTNHLDIAVSQTANPTGSWNIYRVPAQDDGTQGTPNHGCSLGPCFGDYPHIGADANGFYVTTNEYSLFGPEFKAAQIYALSKAALAAGAVSVAVTQLDTTGLVASSRGSQPGFTVWPAQTPGNGYAFSANGTEYFMSSNAADEATVPGGTTAGPGNSTELVVWALTNTSSLNTASPALSLRNTVLTVGQYAFPPKARQPGSGTTADSSGTPNVPLGDCINDTTTEIAPGVFGCWRLLFGSEPAHTEVISRLDANDTRMQQVDFANGKLWGALDTGVTVNSQNRAGIEWFIVKPSVSISGVSAFVAMQGYLGLAGTDLTYPAIGVTASGRGVMAMTLTGDSDLPSAAFTPIDALVGVGPVTVIKAGLGVDDGFTSYKSFVGNPPRTRWGDYGAAAMDGSSVWIASEYIGQSCSYTSWLGFPLGGCPASGYPPAPLNRTRDALGNWYTHISKLTP